MFRQILFITILIVIAQHIVYSCLITNCPRGGKRTGKIGNSENNIKPCVSCGPGHTGQCFGPNICCGPFGCLLGTPETIKCQRDGFFHEREPCIAGTSSCRKNTGRCAVEGICCTQESCHSDKGCLTDDKLSRNLQDNLVPLDFYNFVNYQPPMEYLEK